MELKDIFKIMIGCAGLGVTYFIGRGLLPIFFIGNSGMSSYLIWFILLCLLILGGGLFSIWVIMEGLGLIKSKIKKGKKRDDINIIITMKTIGAIIILIFVYFVIKRIF